MRRVVAVLTGALVACGAETSPTRSTQPVQPLTEAPTGLASPQTQAAPRILVLGHRGLAWNHADNPLPENTLRSVRAAIDAGADGVEIDLVKTADDVIVLRHDDDLARATPGGIPRTTCSGRITESTWSSLADCRAQAFAADGQRAPLARLEEVLALDHLGTVVLDIKNDRDEVEAIATVEQIIGLLERYRRRDRAVLMLYQPETVQAFRDRGVRICLKTIFDRDDDRAQVARAAARMGAWGTCAAGRSVEPDLMDELDARELGQISFLLADQVDDDYRERIGELLELEVDGIITDLIRPTLKARARYRSLSSAR